MKLEYNVEITNPFNDKTWKNSNKSSTLRPLKKKNKFKPRITSKMMNNNCLLAAIFSI